MRFCLPFKTRPLFASFLDPSLFFCCLDVFLFAVVASLFFSLLSGAGEPQTARRFVVPLVFSPSWTRPPPTTRSPSSTTTSRSTSRTCFFGFFVGVSLSLSLSLSLSGVGRPGCACRHNRTDGGGLQDGAPTYYHDDFLLASFWGKSIGQCPGQSALNCRCSPHFPQSPKVGAGRGSGGGNRIVTQMRSLGVGPVLSHIFGFALPRLEGGNAVHFSFLRFFGLVLVLCRFLAKFSSSKGRFLRKIFGSELLFLLSF